MQVIYRFNNLSIVDCVGIMKEEIIFFYVVEVERKNENEEITIDDDNK